MSHDEWYVEGPGADRPTADGTVSGVSPPNIDPVAAVAVDGWALAGLPGAVRFASYLTVREHAAQYRLIVDVLLAAQQHSLTGVPRDDLPGLLFATARDRLGDAAARGLVTDPSFDLAARMQQLVAWSTVEVWQDRAQTEEDFLRNRDRYQLTPEAARLHRFLSDDFARSGAATTAVLAPSLIAAQLGEFEKRVVAGELGDADQAWALIQTTVRDMTAAAQEWQSWMSSALAGAPTRDKVELLHKTVLNYVEVWGASVDVATPAIEAAVARLDAQVSGLWRRLALHRVPPEADDQQLDRVVAEHVDTLHTLRAFFVGASCQARRLRRQVRDAVPDLLRGHRTLLAVGGTVTRRAELLGIAASIEAADSDAAGWQVWCAATGLFAPRHLSGLAPETSSTGPRTSFLDAPPVPVELRLRLHGPRALVGTPARAPDMARARAHARAEAAAARRELADAEAAVRSRSGLALSSWPQLSRAETALMLELLSAGRAGTRAADGTRSGVSSDGRWRVVLHPPRLGAPAAILGVPDGVIVLDDVAVEVTPA